MAALVATATAEDNEIFKCGPCQAQFRDDDKGRANSDNYRRRKLGCWGSTDEKPVFTVERVEFMSCPGNYWSQEAAAWRQMWLLFVNKGILPFDGALANQPAKVMEAFSVLQSLQESKSKPAKAPARKGASRG